MYQNIEVLNTKERREETEKLGKLALETNKKSIITRFYKPGDVRHYDFEKLTPELIGKKVRIEYYSTGTNPETGIWSGCYREITGTVTYLTPGLITTVGYVVLDDDKCLSAHSGHDFTIQLVPEFKVKDKVIFRSTDSGPEYQKPYNAEIIRLLDESECDIWEVGNMYEIRFGDGSTKHAFEDELSLL